MFSNFPLLSEEHNLNAIVKMQAKWPAAEPSPADRTLILAE